MTSVNITSNELPKNPDNKEKLMWEQLARISHGILSPLEKLSRSRFEDGWIVKYEFYGGSVKSGSAITYVDDPEKNWKKQANRLDSRIINLQRNPNQYFVIRCFEVLPGKFLAMVGGTRKRFWSQLLFIPALKKFQDRFEKIAAFNLKF